MLAHLFETMRQNVLWFAGGDVHITMEHNGWCCVTDVSALPALSDTQNFKSC